MKQILSGLLLLALACSSANAALLSRSSGQACYDDVLNITWIANANLADTTTFGVLGISANVQPGPYWSGTEYAPATSNAWDFYFSIGSQINDDKTNGFYAWAVRPGGNSIQQFPQRCHQYRGIHLILRPQPLLGLQESCQID